MRWRAVQSAALAAVLALVVGAGDASAQILHLDDFPWYAAADTVGRRGALLRYDQYRDPDTHWRCDRVGLMLHLAVGARGVFFVQGDFLRFDTAELSVLDRWPHLAQPDDDGEVDLDWPEETMISGLGRPELGVMFPQRLPLAGEGILGLMAGLPVGRDELYPMSAASLPLRLDWRRTFGRPGGLHGAVRVGWEHTFDSGRDYLRAEAFPGGLRFGVEVGAAADAERGLTVAWAARELSDGHHSRRLWLTGWVPLGDEHALQVRLGRELGGKADRYATWIAGIGWRVRALPREPEAALGSPGHNASTP